MPKKEIQLSNGLKAVISIDEEGEEIIAMTDDGRKGTISLTRHCEYGDYFQLHDLSFEKIKRRGIGRESIKFHKEYFQLPIIATAHDGIKRDDGSHLVGDGLPFVIAMQKAGLIEPFSSENIDCE